MLDFYSAGGGSVLVRNFGAYLLNGVTSRVRIVMFNEPVFLLHCEALSVARIRSRCEGVF